MGLVEGWPRVRLDGAEELLLSQHGPSEPEKGDDEVLPAQIRDSEHTFWVRA